MAARILVAEEDPNTQRLLSETLTQEGYQVVLASNGPDAIAKAAGERPDLVLVDLDLPGLDGYEVVAGIRAEQAGGAHVPIIMLASERDLEHKVRGLRAGADD